MLPASIQTCVAPHRATLADSADTQGMPDDFRNLRAWQIDPLVHISLIGDAGPGGFAQGLTMRNSPATETLRYQDQHHKTTATDERVTTVLRNEQGLEVRHNLEWRCGEPGLWIWSEVANLSDAPVTLAMITSFNLGHLSPFAVDDAPERLWVHRFRSFWSVEGRHDCRRVEDLELERAWLGCGVRSERFGQVGSLPVRKWFPCVALEDRKAGVMWGAQLAWSGSWQMEISRLDDGVSLSGGLADRETGHWTKTLAPQERFETPQALVSCVAGDIDDLCHRLTAMHHAAADEHPAAEHELPIIFNEWCTSWGDPTHDKLVAIAERLQDTMYLVIDAGWYGDPGAAWSNSQGDWQPSSERFPDGLKATCDAIRQRGLIPGLWFELETIGLASEAVKNETLQLTRDGVPVVSGTRRFWDMRQDEVHAYLEERVIDVLDSCGIGYIKVDYNESIGIGVDGAESLGEGLRQHIEGVHRFFRRLRERLPELVIENCSSGGHRLEPAMVGLAAMSSFSDAHEVRDIPIVAANVQRLILPRQSQIWAVLHADEPERRTNYSLAATFLGRMCLSGALAEWSDAQIDHVQRARELYRRAAATIRDGHSRRYGPPVISYRHPRGWQAIVRTSTNQHAALVVVHRFEDDADDILCPLEPGNWQIAGQLTEGGTAAHVETDGLQITGLAPFAGAVFLLG